MILIKTHALGNDFLLLERPELPAHAEVSGLAARACSRHRGIGADGLIVFTRRAGVVSMRLLNADGSASEISGNGLRCLAAWLAHEGAAGAIVIHTDAGPKSLTLLERGGCRYTFRASMGAPEAVQREQLAHGGGTIDAITLRVGNPQCVLLGEVSEERLHGVAAAVAVHPRFPEGTNVELAAVEAPDRVRILIWERGVGPTEASGTGACASAVAAIAYGGAARVVDVVSPGGSQRVEWLEDGLFLTGWAEVVAEVRWFGVDPA